MFTAYMPVSSRACTLPLLLLVFRYLHVWTWGDVVVFEALAPTMKRQYGWKHDIEIWEEFWSAIQNELVGRTASTASTERFTYQPLATTSMNKSTATVYVPGTTIYVSTTILATTFITVPGATVTLSSSSAGSSKQSLSQQNSTVSEPSMTSTNMTSYALPAVTQVMSSPEATSTPALVSNSTTDSMIGEQQTRGEAQKHAIIGGLSGSIAGLVFVGVLICLALRLRRKKSEPKEIDESPDEKGLRPALLRKWTQLTGGGLGSPKQTDLEKRSTSPVSVDEDHRIIRMNTRHWIRPFTAGTGEGQRESQPQGILRVVNPDASRPETPDTALDHFNKQRPSLAGFVLGMPNPSPEAKLQSYPAQKPIPTIQVIDPNLSRECIATYDRTPSFRSYPSVASGPIVTQRTPDDPFVSTPPRRYGEETRSSPPTTRPERPSIMTLQSGAGSTSRWNQLSSHLLHPFAKRNSNTEVVQNVRGLSHFSMSSSATRSSRRSDPFDLSIRGSQPPRGANEFRRGSPNPNWILYEGT